MNDFHHHKPHTPYAVGAALAVTAATLVALLSLFEQAATPWIAATPSNLQRMAACEQVPGSALRSGCRQRIVASVLAASAPRVAVITPGDAAAPR